MSIKHLRLVHSLVLPSLIPFKTPCEVSGAAKPGYSSLECFLPASALRIKSSAAYPLPFVGLAFHVVFVL